MSKPPWFFITPRINTNTSTDPSQTSEKKVRAAIHLIPPGRHFLIKSLCILVGFDSRDEIDAPAWTLISPFDAGF